MQKVLRVLSAIVVACAVTVGSTQSHPWYGSFDEDAAAMALFQVLPNAIQEGGGAHGPLVEMRAAARDGAAVLSNGAPYGGEGDAICAFLVGAGGTPRLDGGGDLLGFRSPAVVPQPWVVQLGKHAGLGPSANLWPDTPEEDRLVIIDSFDLADLTSVIDRVIEVSEGVAVSPGDPGPSAIWHAFYGSRLASEPSTKVSEVQVPHGHLVAFHALAHLGPDAKIVGVELSSQVGYEVAILTLERNNDPATAFEVHLVHVEFDQFESIASAMNAYRDGPRDEVVTSWGFVDCAIESHYRASAPAPDESISAYFQEALSASEQAAVVLEGLCVALNDIIAEALELDQGPDCGNVDDLADLATIVWIADVSIRSARALNWEPNEGGARFFASAGNQGLSIPMPPAAWPGVVGVEACTANGFSDRSSFSNVGGAGELSARRALGDWFAPSLAEAPDQFSYGYWGTSFAAPAAAAVALATPSTHLLDFAVPPCQ